MGDPGALDRLVDTPSPQRPQDQRRCLRPDPPFLVGVPKRRQTLKTPRQPRTVLRRRARDPQALLTVVTHTREPKTPPRSALSHLEEELPQPAIDLVLHLHESPDQLVRVVGPRLGPAAQPLDAVQRLLRLLEKPAIGREAAQELPSLARRGEGLFPCRARQPVTAPVRPPERDEGGRPRLGHESLDEGGECCPAPRDCAVQIVRLVERGGDRHRHVVAERAADLRFGEGTRL